LHVGYFEITEKYNNEKELENIVENALKNRKFEIIGIVGMIDPPRKEAKKAIRKCNEARNTYNNDNRRSCFNSNSNSKRASEY